VIELPVDQRQGLMLNGMGVLQTGDKDRRDDVIG